MIKTRRSGSFLRNTKFLIKTRRSASNNKHKVFDNIKLADLQDLTLRIRYRFLKKQLFHVNNVGLCNAISDYQRNV